MSEHKVLTRDTLIPIGVAVAVILAITSGVVWLNRSLDRITFGIEALSADLQRVQVRIDNVSSDLWRRSDMEWWAKLMRAQNAQLVVPDVGK